MDDIIKIEPNELRTEMQKLRAEGYDFMRSLTSTPSYFSIHMQSAWRFWCAPK